VSEDFLAFYSFYLKQLITLGIAWSCSTSSRDSSTSFSSTYFWREFAGCTSRPL